MWNPAHTTVQSGMIAAQNRSTSAASVRSRVWIAPTHATGTLFRYGSQTYVDDVIADVTKAGRPAVLLYAGDHDPSGEDIDRDFTARTDCWDEVRRVALTAAHLTQYALPPQPGKDTDSRAAGFIARHGRLVQVELDALPPDVLRTLYAHAIADFWNDDAYEQALAREAVERRRLTR